MKRSPGAIAGVAVLLAVLSADFYAAGLVNPYVYQILLLCGVNIVLAVSLNLVNGFTGQFSIGHAGFMALGGYVSAAVAYYGARALGGPHAWLFGVALLAGALVAAVAGFLVGLPSLRLRGDYLAIVTLGFGEIIRTLILNVDAVGGARGFSDIPILRLLFSPQSEPRPSLSLVGAAAFLTVLVIYRMIRSPRGRAFIAVREDEVAAEALGIDTTRYKVTAFVVGAFFAGLAGGLFAHTQGYLNPSSFQFMKSIEIVIMVVLGGMGSLTGSILAAVILTVLPEVLRPVQEYRMVLYSALLIVLMLARPQGVFGPRELSWPRAWRRRTGGTAAGDRP
ncbi:MAG: branched-chain amino acid ABC transporter permease [Candidatus Eisenbacteria bacterium]|nr:branched-chain amino acid ABC transporter permease [Candidatus Eisenbacteria bacterium]